MAQTTTTTLVLVFKQAGEKNPFRLTVSNPKPNMVGTTVKGILDAIVAANVLGEKTLVTGVVEAYYADRVVDTIDLSMGA